MPIKWCNFCTELKAKFILSNALDLDKQELEELSIKKEGHVTEINKHFHLLRSKLDLHQPMPAAILSDAYAYGIKWATTEGMRTSFVILACAKGLQPWT
jgi:hypothetical protein